MRRLMWLLNIICSVLAVAAPLAYIAFLLFVADESAWPSDRAGIDRQAELSLSMFAAFGTMAGLALAATSIVIAGTSRHRDAIERDVTVWNALLSAVVWSSLAWAAAAVFALLAWAFSQPWLYHIAVGGGLVSGFVSMRAFIWVAGAVMRLRTPD